MREIFSVPLPPSNQCSLWMKGLEEYIEKHGRHFTVELASAVLPIRWGAREVAAAAESRVYYNVTASTLGDMVFLTNSRDSNRKSECIKYALSKIGDYGNYERIFPDWLSTQMSAMKGFDFTPYI